MIARVLAMIAKEFRQVFRDPRMRAILFVAPILQLFVFSYAANTDVHHLATVVLDRDQSAMSRELESRFFGSTYFDRVADVETDAEAEAALDHGRARVLLVLPAGFEADADAGKAPAVMLAADGTNANVAALAIGYASRITAEYARERGTALQARLGRSPPGPPLSLESRAWYNENLESRNFYVPAILALLITIVTLILTAMAIVREREIGTLEQLLVTPIRPIEMILGKTVPFALIGLFDAAVVLAIAIAYFQIPMRGSVVLFFAAIALYLLTTLSGGLLISTISRTQQQAMMGAFLFVFPAILLSGFMFPIANMPPVVQAFTYVNPLRYMIEILRGLFLKGAGLDLLWPDFAALALLGTLALVTAVSRFRETLG
jgi:ABC-2 type transport system permease protein